MADDRKGAEIALSKQEVERFVSEMKKRPYVNEISLVEGKAPTTVRMKMSEGPIFWRAVINVEYSFPEKAPVLGKFTRLCDGFHIYTRLPIEFRTRGIARRPAFVWVPDTVLHTSYPLVGALFLAGALIYANGLMTKNLQLSDLLLLFAFIFVGICAYIPAYLHLWSFFNRFHKDAEAAVKAAARR